MKRVSDEHIDAKLRAHAGLNHSPRADEGDDGDGQ